MFSRICNLFLVFVRKKCLEKIFGDVLDKEKTSFLDYKNINFTWLSNLMFSWGLVHDVLKFFISCFYAKKNLEKMFGDVLDRKHAFLKL